MYGFFNIIIKTYIKEKHGEEAWAEVVRRSKAPKEFEDQEIYADGVSDKMIDAACSVLNFTRDPLLEQMGEFYLDFVRKKSGHDEFLRNLGSNILEFIINLDDVHSHMRDNYYSDINAPSFFADPDSSSDRIVLHYYSFRKGLQSLVQGILKAAARHYFHMNLKIEVLSITPEQVAKKNGFREHVVFKIMATRIPQKATMAPPTFVYQTKKHGEKQIKQEDVDKVKAKLEAIKKKGGKVPIAKGRAAKAKWKALARIILLSKAFVPTFPSVLELSARLFSEIFPFHIMFDQNLKIRQLGLKIQQMMPDIRNPSLVTEYFELQYPHSVDLSFEHIQKFINTPFVLKLRAEKMNKTWVKSRPLLEVKGQMILVKDKNWIIYICSPFVRTLNDLEVRNMKFADIPMHDVTRELILDDMEYRLRHGYDGSGKGGGRYGGAGSGGGRAGAVIINGAGGNDGSGGGQLEQLRRELEAEREKNDSLMHAFLPRSVADQLRRGQVPQGGEYREVSALFCDVVKFTEMANKCRVQDVIQVLNGLHNRFDKITQVHDTYRVEAIGDAYFVLSGCPEKNTTHVERISNTALGMLVTARDVKSPMTRDQIMIRIGVHTGTIICGVVGDKLPRFLVMGETANVASRLESHGLPGKIHISPTTNKALRGRGYNITERGEVELRNSGKFSTYFLLSNDHFTEEELTGNTRYSGTKPPPGKEGFVLFMYTDTPNTGTSKINGTRAPVPAVGKNRGR